MTLSWSKRDKENPTVSQEPEYWSDRILSQGQGDLLDRWVEFRGALILQHNYRTTYAGTIMTNTDLNC